ncbi:MAG: SH3 domain-containing protein [Planctomycetota bacterium]|jgi:hypothetical protein
MLQLRSSKRPSGSSFLAPAALVGLLGLSAWGALPAIAQEGAGSEGEVAPATQDGSEQAPATARRLVRAREGGLTLRNLYDVQGTPLLEVSAGALLTIHQENSGWLGVEPAGGFPVWVKASNLAETETPGVLRVTSNRVNMRPSPSADVTSFPLTPQRLRAGDRLALIRKADPEAALADTWAQVWSPPGVYAWTQTSRTEALSDLSAADAEAQWNAAVEALISSASNGQSRPSTDEPKPEPTPVVHRSEVLLTEARALLATEREKSAPDFDQVRLAYGRVEQAEPTPAVALELERELEMLEALEELARTQNLLEEEILDRRQQLLSEMNKRLDTLRATELAEGRYRLRGNLEVHVDSRGGRSFLLRRGPQIAAELVCESGRYELELFVGCELAVEGGVNREESVLEGEFVQVDVARVQIVSRR